MNKVYGVGINDCSCKTVRYERENGVWKRTGYYKAYSTWVKILRRCYLDNEFHNDVAVSEDWKNSQILKTGILKIMRKGREYRVGVILSTQDITHFKTGENNYASYILTWIIHRVAEIRNADIKAIFNVDDKSQQEGLMETIRKLEKHYSLYIDGEKKLTKMRDKAFWEL